MKTDDGVMTDGGVTTGDSVTTDNGVLTGDSVTTDGAVTTDGEGSCTLIGGWIILVC